MLIPLSPQYGSSVCWRLENRLGGVCWIRVTYCGDIVTSVGPSWIKYVFVLSTLRAKKILHRWQLTTNSCKFDSNLACSCSPYLGQPWATFLAPGAKNLVWYTVGGGGMIRQLLVCNFLGRHANPLMLRRWKFFHSKSSSPAHRVKLPPKLPSSGYVPFPIPKQSCTQSVNLGKTNTFHPRN